MAEMRRSWLVQRLNKPLSFNARLGIKDNPFAFGGGLKNGGLSDDAMDLIRDVWSFDYMGAAEFEFGAVPKALREIAGAKLITFIISVPLAEVPKNWRDHSDATPDGESDVYVICPERFRDGVTERVNAWARNEYPSLKERLGFTSALRPFEYWDHRRGGWLELDNGFLFFTDRDMWEKACRLFGIDVAAVAS